MNGLNTYSREDLEKQKEKYLDLLRSTEREGIEDLIEWLETTDFFEAPASTKGHGSFIGGLLLHSINVYTLLKNFNVKAGAPEDSLMWGSDGTGGLSMFLLARGWNCFLTVP